MYKKGCIEEKADKIIVMSENGRKMVLKNASRKSVKVVRVDGCQITDARERCDYLCDIEESAGSVMYVELKGADIAKAVNQLASTIKYFMTEHQKRKREAFVVASRVPRAGPKMQRVKSEFIREHGVPLMIGTRQVAVSV